MGIELMVSIWPTVDKTSENYVEMLKSGFSVGYGHNEKVWKDIVSALRAVGYDYVLSIEHEDMLASIDEGLMKAITLLKGTLFKEQLTEMWWA
jgi:sugar phosphate isomerase/epimerase